MLKISGGLKSNRQFTLQNGSENRNYPRSVGLERKSPPFNNNGAECAYLNPPNALSVLDYTLEYEF